MKKQDYKLPESEAMFAEFKEFEKEANKFIKKKKNEKKIKTKSK